MTAAEAAHHAHERAHRSPTMSTAPIAPAGSLPRNRVPALSARLARLAVEVDELAWQIIAEPLSERDELFLAAPTAHLALALEWLEQALYETDRLDLTQSWAASLRRGAKETNVMRTPKVSEIPALPFPASREERERVFWRLSPSERIALMRAGKLTLTECCRWAARRPHEVPVVNGEFEFIAAFMPEAGPACEQ